MGTPHSFSPSSHLDPESVPDMYTPIALPEGDTPTPCT